MASVRDLGPHARSGAGLTELRAGVYMAGDLFQANIARAWSGSLHAGADPFDVMLRLANRSAAYGAFWRLGDRAVVSNSPELFLTFDPDSRRIESRPIKGTRPFKALRMLVTASNT